MTATGGTSSPSRWSGSRFAKAWWATVRAAGVAAVLALLFAVVLAVWQMAKNPILRLPGTIVIELLRGLPLLILILFLLLGFGLSSFRALVLGLTLYNGAIIAEILPGRDHPASRSASPRRRMRSGSPVGRRCGRSCSRKPCAGMLPLHRQPARRPAQGHLARVHRRLCRAAPAGPAQCRVLRRPLHVLVLLHRRGDVHRHQLHGVPAGGLAGTTGNHQGRRPQARCRDVRRHHLIAIRRTRARPDHLAPW